MSKTRPHLNQWNWRECGLSARSPATTVLQFYYAISRVKEWSYSGQQSVVKSFWVIVYSPQDKLWNALVDTVMSTRLLTLRALTITIPCGDGAQKKKPLFENYTDELTSDRVMAYFDPTKLRDVLVDASPTGLGAIPVQNDKVVSYGSRVLFGVEARYSQTEPEMLAVVWTAEHYHIYLCRATLIVSTNLWLLSWRVKNPPSQESADGKLTIMVDQANVTDRDT